jgi:hypothetical protein
MGGKESVSVVFSRTGRPPWSLRWTTWQTFGPLPGLVDFTAAALRLTYPNCRRTRPAATPGFWSEECGGPNHSVIGNQSINPPSGGSQC